MMKRLCLLILSLSLPLSRCLVLILTGLGELLSSEDEEALLSSGLSQDSTTRLRPTFETLEASLTEGRYDTGIWSHFCL